MIDRILEHMEQAESLIDALWRKQRALEAQRDALLVALKKISELNCICHAFDPEAPSNWHRTNCYKGMALAAIAEAEREG